MRTKETQQLREKTTKQQELKVVWIDPEKAELADDDLRTSGAVQITYPSKGGPILIKEDEPSGQAFSTTTTTVAQRY